ncbi:MAG: zinc-binding alcohol dehydrogenase [Woeseiaceae bacterium]|nr:zinc-binding alcohol dehydrogenase [Woeseiaceae bacterium]
MPQRIVFPEKGVVALESFTLPELGPGDIQVRTLYSLMSIGTETTILHEKYAPGTHFDRMFSFPQLKTGMQAVGIVESAGGGVDEFRIGDTIFMRMAHGSHQVQPSSRCSPVPDGIDRRSACWAGLAKTAFRAAWAARFAPGLHILVIGAGPVGQMTVRWAAAAGVDTIAVADLSETRLQHAKRGGATSTLVGDVGNHLQQICDIDGGKGPSVVVDTTGNPQALGHALAAAAKFGKVILLGDTGFPERQCLTSNLMTKSLTIQATHDSHDRDGWDQRRIDRLFYRWVKSGRIDLSGLITHEFAPRECVQAYATADEKRDLAIGILFDWSRT